MATIRFAYINAPSNAYKKINPILFSGELGIETDTQMLKAGVGVSSWANLPYITLDGASTTEEVSEVEGSLYISESEKDDIDTLMTDSYFELVEYLDDTTNQVRYIAMVSNSVWRIKKVDYSGAEIIRTRADSYNNPTFKLWINAWNSRGYLTYE